MRTFVITDGFVLTDEMYELARFALERRAPDLVERFTAERFFNLNSWLLVPDVGHPDLPFYKAEMTVLNEWPWDRTFKFNVWFAPDLRQDGRPMPHSHPWGFESELLTGGYVEDRYELADDSRLIDDPFSSFEVGAVDVSTGVLLEAGAEGRNRNRIPRQVFHEVKEVLVPGGTLTCMHCGPGVKGGWGYLTESGLYVPNADSPFNEEFQRLVEDRNPHRHKRR